MADRFGHGQNRFQTVQRLADDIGEKARCRRIGCARTHANRRQADADAVEKALAGIIGQQQFPDGFLRPVGGQRGGEKLVANGGREGGAKNRNRGGEDHARMIST